MVTGTLGAFCTWLPGSATEVEYHLRLAHDLDLLKTHEL